MSSGRSAGARILLAAAGKAANAQIARQVGGAQPGVVMQDFIDEVSQLLPLDIITTDFDSSGMTISGHHWLLRINTNWRLTRDGQVIASKSIVEGKEGRDSEHFSGDGIIKVACQSNLVRIDPSFTLRSGRTLEIFSDYSYAEWRFSTWLESDPRQLPVIDYEGPIA